MNILPMEIIIVAVVLPFRSNHDSEYMGPMIWKTSWEIDTKN
jgi:hypothetical protein